jgi:hypothetical protein
MPPAIVPLTHRLASSRATAAALPGASRLFRRCRATADRPPSGGRATSGVARFPTRHHPPLSERGCGGGATASAAMSRRDTAQPAVSKAQVHVSALNRQPAAGRATASRAERIRPASRPIDQWRRGDSLHLLPAHTPAPRRADAAPRARERKRESTAPRRSTMAPSDLGPSTSSAAGHPPPSLPSPSTTATRSGCRPLPPLAAAPRLSLPQSLPQAP